MNRFWKILLIIGLLMVVGVTVAAASSVDAIIETNIDDCEHLTVTGEAKSASYGQYDVKVMMWIDGQFVDQAIKDTAMHDRSAIVTWSGEKTPGVHHIIVQSYIRYDNQGTWAQMDTEETDVTVSSCTVELGISKDETCDGYELVVNPPLSQIVGVIKYSRYAVRVDTLWSNYGFPQVYSSVWDGNEQVTLVVHLKFKTYG